VILLCNFSFGQIAWTWIPRANMPIRVSNNAVSEGKMGVNQYVFSFGGIDSTKIWSGITKRSFRYDVNVDSWIEIDTLPVALPLIASSANTVKNKIYIIGGYHVFSNGIETSSDEVIIYNPQTNIYEANGTAVPIPIDDQAQAVWRDSLIYVISGWSNTTNVPNIQIYDPALDQWQVGTSLLNINEYKVFGSSAEIIGDTIYYHGGASLGFNFPARAELRKGIINPTDPTQITWSLDSIAPNPNYRSACLTNGTNLFWVGGSTTSYNFDGVAYNGSGGVEPTMKIMRYEAFGHDWYEGISPFGVMDLRGNGQVSTTDWIICGGMESGQVVSNKTYLLTYDPVTGGVSELGTQAPAFKIVNRELIFDIDVEQVRLIGLDGKIISEIQDFKISTKFNGVYLLEFWNEGQVYRKRISLD
jgi:Kelch motif